MAAQTLRVLAERLGHARSTPCTRRSRARCIHELRVGRGRARSTLTPLAPLLRHGRRDAAVPLPARASTRSGAASLALFDELRDAVEATLGWIDGYGDHDGDGLLDYRASTPGRAAQPGLEGLRRRRARRARHAARAADRPDRAAGATRCAPSAASRALFAHAGDARRARRAAPPRPPRSRAGWSASGSPSGGFYSMGLDADGRAERARSPPTRATRCGRRAVSPERARRRARRADGRRPVLGLGHPDARAPRGRVQPGRLPPRHRLAARHRAVRRRPAPLRLRRGLRHRSSRRCSRPPRTPTTTACRSCSPASRAPSSRRPCPTRSPATRRRGPPARSRTC